MNHNFAPVIILVYNRLKNIKQVIKALQKNDLAKETEVFIYSDGAKTSRDQKKIIKIRDYLKTINGFKKVNIIEREINYYIERNMTEAVTEIINKYGRVIVLEDDGVPSKDFLIFMNKALDFYEYEKKVMHIATFTFIKMPEKFNKTFFWSYSENTGGGWATWKDRWDKFIWFQNEKDALFGLTEQHKEIIELNGMNKSLSFVKLNPIPWDICWNIAIVKNNGLAVNSPWPLIKNNGLYNGTHFTIVNKIFGKNPFEIDFIKKGAKDIVFENRIFENNEAKILLKKFYSDLNNKKIQRSVNFLIRKLSNLKNR